MSSVCFFTFVGGFEGLKFWVYGLGHCNTSLDPVRDLIVPPDKNIRDSNQEVSGLCESVEAHITYILGLLLELALLEWCWLYEWCAHMADTFLGHDSDEQKCLTGIGRNLLNIAQFFFVHLFCSIV